ncbi:MAG: hypothetical protein M0Z66_14675 [Thermaerobacter sp.]|nr:hypothetical protein [Thermaerobacter sp.]
MKEGQTINRRSVAIIAFVAAAAALAAIFLSIRPIAAWRLPAMPIRIGSVGVQGISFAQGKSAARTLPATGVREVQIDAPLGSVALSTMAASSIHLHWTVPGSPDQAVRTALQDGVLTIHFQPQGNVVNFGANVNHLDVTIPGGLSVSAQIDAGAMSVQGDFSNLSATLQAGALNVQNFRGALTAHDSMGAINVQQATITGPLSLTADMGAISFAGDPGLAATVRADMGAVDLAISPHGRLTVQGSVQMGQFSSAFPGLRRGGGGSFSGTVGQGKPGYLNVSDQMGPVSIDQF